MNKKFLTAAVAALGIVGVSVAQSSTTQIDATPSNLTFRLGVVFPLDDNLRENSDLYGGLGVDYTFPTQLIKGSTTYASLDWFFKGSNGRNGNVFPIAINQRFYSKTGNSFYPDGRSYFFIGGGVAIIDVSNRSDTKFMIRGGVGTELGPNIIAEAAATFSDRSKVDVRANAIGIYIGYRF
jgi:hypothetical protein